MSNDMPTQLERLALLLFDLNAVRFGSFRLKLHETKPDAPLSPIFLNLRTPDNPKPGPLDARAVDLVGEVLYATHCAARLEYIHLAGVPRAGDPFVDALHRVVARPGCRVLRLGKQEGAGKRQVTGVQNGSYVPGDTVLLVDDLITKADSKLEAIKALEAQGLVVKDVLVLVDREQGGRAELASEGYRLHAAYTLMQLLDLYVARDRLDAAKRDEVLAYARDDSS